MTSPYDEDPVLVEVVRHGFAESAHHGRVAVTDPDGALAFSLGPADAAMYPRSAAKPLQAVGLLRAGLPTRDALLALVCASHSGEPFHLDGVRRILADAGLDESDLQTPADWPLDELEKEKLIRAGGSPAPILMNCSGQHAGMLAATVAGGQNVADYLDPDHPTQLTVLGAIDELTGEQAGLVAPDGCGAPLFAITLAGLSRAFGRLAGATGGDEARVATAMRDFPEYVSGTRRDELALQQAVPGLIAKIGAEGVYAAGLPDGRGIAIKISDGSTRARTVVMARILQRLGLDHPTLTDLVKAPVLGRGVRVGELRPTAVLAV